MPELDSSELVLVLWCLGLVLTANVFAMPLFADAIDSHSREPAHGLTLGVELVLLAPFWLAVYLQEKTGVYFYLTLFLVGAAGGLLLGALCVWLLRRLER